MADSAITNLPPFVGTPAIGDLVAIDNISESVNTATQKISLTQLFNEFLGLIGLITLKVDNINGKTGSLPNFPAGVQASSTAPFYELKNTTGPDTWRMQIVGTDFIIHSVNGPANIFKIVKGAGLNSFIIGADSSTEMNIVKGSDYRNKAGTGPAPFSLFLKSNEIQELTNDNGVLVDKLPIKDGHIAHAFIELDGVSGSDIYDAFNAIVPNPVLNERFPMTGGASTGGVTMWLSSAIRISATAFRVDGMATTGDFQNLVFTAGAGGNFDITAYPL